MALAGDFQQWVALSGYEWRYIWVPRPPQEEELQPDWPGVRMLTPIGIDAGPLEYRLYKPANEPRFFRRLARLFDAWEDPEELDRRIIDFANEYGCLYFEPHEYGVTGSHSGTMIGGEPRTRWLDAILQMNRAVELLNNINRIEGIERSQKKRMDSGDKKRIPMLREFLERIESREKTQLAAAKGVLEQRIRWEGLYWSDGGVIAWEDDDGIHTKKKDRAGSVDYQRRDTIRDGMSVENWENIAGSVANQYPGVLEAYPDIVHPAKVCVQLWANAALEGHATHCALLHTDPKKGGQSLRMSCYTDGLLTVMWLQVAQALVGDVQWKECQNPKCKLDRWFPVGHEDKRSQSKYCDTSCKNAVNNARRSTTRAGRKRPTQDPSARLRRKVAKPPRV